VAKGPVAKRLSAVMASAALACDAEDFEMSAAMTSCNEMSDQELDVHPALPEEGWLSKFEEWLTQSWGSAVPAGFGEWLREKAGSSQDLHIFIHSFQIQLNQFSSAKFPMM
jgi:hypothetical protein